jgi:hypothetical protein
MNGDVRYQPCGFCGVKLGGGLQCPDCGTWWTSRNFHFGQYQISNNKGIPEIYGSFSDFFGGPKEPVWLGFDEDDGQAMEVLAVEDQGWLFGEKFYKSTSPLHRDDDGVLLDLSVPAGVATEEYLEEIRLQNRGLTDEEIEVYKRIRALKLDVLNPAELAEEFVALVVERNRNES